MTNQTFTINGMTCDACTKLTAKRIKAIDGVLDASVDLESRRANVTTERHITADEINTAFGECNYRAEDK